MTPSLPGRVLAMPTRLSEELQKLWDERAARGRELAARKANFRERWDVARKMGGHVYEVFAEVASFLGSDSRMSVWLDQPNDGLRVYGTRRAGTTEFSLTFEPDYERCEVYAISSLRDKPVTYKLDNLTTDALWAAMHAFVGDVADRVHGLESPQTRTATAEISPRPWG
jgi:hypothetical protein